MWNNKKLRQNFPSSFKMCQNFPQNKTILLKMPQTYKLAKKAKFLQIWSHWCQNTCTYESSNFSSNWNDDTVYTFTTFKNLKHDPSNIRCRDSNSELFLKKMGQPRPLFRLFLVFSSKQYNFYKKSMWKTSKCPSSLQRQDSNPKFNVHESSPITTRQGLPPSLKVNSTLLI